MFAIVKNSTIIIQKISFSSVWFFKLFISNQFLIWHSYGHSQGGNYLIKCMKTKKKIEEVRKKEEKKFFLSPSQHNHRHLYMILYFCWILSYMYVIIFVLFFMVINIKFSWMFITNLYAACCIVLIYINVIFYVNCFSVKKFQQSI